MFWCPLKVTRSSDMSSYFKVNFCNIEKRGLECWESLVKG
jgi:hypothetical protein